MNKVGATVGLMYGSYQTYVALNARNVRYPKNNTRPAAVAAGCTHQESTRRVSANEASAMACDIAGRVRTPKRKPSGSFNAR